MANSNDYRRQFCTLEEEVKNAIRDLMQSNNLTEIELQNIDGLFDCECYDGYAICTDEETNTKVIMTYPTLAEVLDDEDLCDKILQYRGLYDLQAKDIHFGDIMMCLGEIEKN